MLQSGEKEEQGGWVPRADVLDQPLQMNANVLKNPGSTHGARGRGEPEKIAQKQQDAPPPSQTSNKKEQERELSKKRMNVVLLYADDWSFNTLGAMGNDYVKTPILDQLAAEGMLATHNCVVASVCMQSRATLYTGQYSSRHQTFFSWRNVTMYEGERWSKTLYPQMMQNNYHVGFFGKYHHLEPPPSQIPTFSEYRSALYSHYFKRDGVEKHVTQWNEEDSIDFLKNRPKDKPFFLTTSFFATHAEDGSKEQYRPMNTSMSLYEEEPVPVPKTLTDEHWQALPHFFNENNAGRGRFRGRFDTPEVYQHMMKNTYRMATEVDTACGRILKLIEEQGELDNTIIIFTTDNGNFHGQHGLSEKWYAFEESLRVPLIIKDPRMPVSKIGTKSSEFTLNIDLAPTILSAAGISPPDVMQGQDMAQLYLNDTVKWRQEFLYEFWDDNERILNSMALVRKDFKYIYWNDHNFSQVFDMEKDPFEENDLFGKTDQELIDRMWYRMNELQRSAKEGAPQ